MMFLNNLMNSRNLTRAELSASSNIPESTLRDILNGKAQLDRCEAVTLYNLAYALDVSVEDILEDYWEELALGRTAHTRIPVHDDHSLMNFCVLADSMLGRLRATGDLAFIDGIDQNEWVERLYDDGQYRCALFLVGVMDYLCRKNGIWQIARYNEYRELRLDTPVYSLSTLNVNSGDGDFQRARNDAENNAMVNVRPAIAASGSKSGMFLMPGCSVICGFGVIWPSCERDTPYGTTVLDCRIAFICRPNLFTSCWLIRDNASTFSCDILYLPDKMRGSIEGSFFAI